ncbi:hypothetical protein [Pediococcus acidilactici]|uniref:hypothetical protein n=1 Tax=Pediococcus acidilactici TaxID=1254 RepID=UPI001951DFBE|nr:hypothetical protein [Pediococcus acidilactici]MBM6585951.1 hypothetical protein [Pediococcus acidilactici]MCI1276472.1 hypothetical protein [Pediococcus acidilactici]
MSRTQRLVHFDFWMNNFLILPLLIISLALSNLLPGLATFVIAFLITTVGGVIQRHHHQSMGVKYNQFFYPGDDEREQKIVYAILRSVTSWFIASCFILFLSLLFIPLFTLSAKTTIAFIGTGLAVIFLTANAIYYFLWFKYDPQ